LIELTDTVEWTEFTIQWYPVSDLACQSQMTQFRFKDFANLPRRSDPLKHTTTHSKEITSVWFAAGRTGRVASRKINR